MSWRISLEVLADELGLSPADLDDCATRAPTAWKREPREIGGKVRTLSLPAGWLRAIQKKILRRVLSRLPDHPSSFCTKGRGAYAAACRHARHSSFLHLDIKSFFPSVRPDVLQVALETLKVQSDAAARITTLCTAHNELPQGASTSVALGNVVLSKVDRRLAGLCVSQGLTYTRYVDDLGFSGGGRLERFEKRIRSIVAEEGWQVGSGKGGLAGPNASHRYVGLLLGASPNIERPYIDDLRRILGLAEKGQIELTDHQRRSLRGKIQYVRAINIPVGEILLRRVDALCHQQH